MRRILLRSLIPVLMLLSSSVSLAQTLIDYLRCMPAQDAANFRRFFEEQLGIDIYNEPNAFPWVEFYLRSQNHQDLAELRTRLAQYYSISKQAGLVQEWAGEPGSVLQKIQATGNIISLYFVDDDALENVFASSDLTNLLNAYRIQFIHQDEHNHEGIHREFEELEQSHSHILYQFDDRNQVINSVLQGLANAGVLSSYRASQIVSDLLNQPLSCPLPQ